MTFASIFNDSISLGAFLLIGFILRELFKPLQKLLLPASVIGGVLALLLGPQVLGLVAIPESFASMSGVFINFVLTTTVIGVAMDKSKAKAYLTHTNLMVLIYGMQMALGTALGLGFSIIWKDMPFGWGVMGVFSFWGGHGTAAGAGAAFEEYAVAGNTAMGMILSTIGILSAVICGMVLVNWGVRKGYAAYATSNFEANRSFFGGLLPKEKQIPIGVEKVSNTGINNMALQLGIIFACMKLGNLVMGLVKEYVPVLSSLPSLLNGILAGAVVWAILKKTPYAEYVDRKTINSWGGVALELTICSAIATIDLKMAATYIVPIGIYSVIIIAATAWVSIVFAKKWHRINWFEKCCGAFGAANGNITTGFALIRCVDPEGATDASDALAVGNSIWAPVYGSFPAFIPMFCMLTGIWVPMAIGVALVVVSLICGAVFFTQKA